LEGDGTIDIVSHLFAIHVNARVNVGKLDYAQRTAEGQRRLPDISVPTGIRRTVPAQQQGNGKQATRSRLEEKPAAVAEGRGLRSSGRPSAVVKDQLRQPAEEPHDQ
jgi:hypothetical protein